MLFHSALKNWCENESLCVMMHHSSRGGIGSQGKKKEKPLIERCFTFSEQFFPFLGDFNLQKLFAKLFSETFDVFLSAAAT
jgi:hypothetical protein